MTTGTGKPRSLRILAQEFQKLAWPFKDVRPRNGGHGWSHSTNILLQEKQFHCPCLCLFLSLSTITHLFLLCVVSCLSSSVFSEKEQRGQERHQQRCTGVLQAQLNTIYKAQKTAEKNERIRRARGVAPKVTDSIYSQTTKDLDDDRGKWLSSVNKF